MARAARASLRAESRGSPWSHSSTATLARPKAATTAASSPPRAPPPRRWGVGGAGGDGELGGAVGPGVGPPPCVGGCGAGGAGRGRLVGRAFGGPGGAVAAVPPGGLVGGPPVRRPRLQLPPRH